MGIMVIYHATNNIKYSRAKIHVMSTFTLFIEFNRLLLENTKALWTWRINFPLSQHWANGKSVL